MKQRAFQLPFYDNDGTTAALVVNVWLAKNTDASIQEIHCAQCECGAPLVFGVAIVPDSFKGEMPSDTYILDYCDEVGCCDDGRCDGGCCDDGRCDDGRCDDGCCDDGGSNGTPEHNSTAYWAPKFTDAAYLARRGGARHGGVRYDGVRCVDDPECADCIESCDSCRCQCCMSEDEAPERIKYSSERGEIRRR